MADEEARDFVLKVEELHSLEAMMCLIMAELCLKTDGEKMKQAHQHQQPTADLYCHCQAAGAGNSIHVAAE